MDIAIADIIQLLNGGGNLALCVCAVFIHRASEKLARIEKALQKYMDQHEK